MSKTFQIQPYLRVQRKFPPESSKDLASQVDQAYIDIAGKINMRMIGVFGLNFFMETGEVWYLQGQPTPQNTFRQVYLFNNSTLTIPHELDFETIDYFTRIYGTFFDGTFWDTLPYIDVVSSTRQINVQVNNTDIIINKGASGSTPTIVKGIIVLEWLSQV